MSLGTSFVQNINKAPRMHAARKFSWFHILVVYLKKAPLFIGEIFILLIPFALALALNNGSIKKDELLGLAMVLPFAGIGSYIVFKKVKTAANAYKSLKHGIEGVATLVNIESTSVKHNRNRVYAYTFSYDLSGRPYEYVFKSAYHRALEVSSQPFKIYFLPENPKVCFIPKLYFKNEHKFDA